MAGAVSAKATGTAGIAAALLVAGPAIVRRRGWGTLGAVVALPAVAVLAWLAVTQVRYGTPDGSAAFRAAYGNFYSPSTMLSSRWNPATSRPKIAELSKTRRSIQRNDGDLVPFR